MSAVESPYHILNVPTNATDAQIKKAFRDFSLKWHPDRNKAPHAEEMFKKGKNAQALLLDKEKRQAFDQTGTVSNESTSYSQRDVPKCEPVHVNLPLTLSDIYNCVTKSVTVAVTIYGKLEHRTIPIEVDSNFEFEKTVCIVNAGNSKPDHIDGDVMVKLVRKVESSVDNFEIEGTNLLREQTLSLAEVVGGFRFPIKHPSGKTLVVSGQPLNAVEQTYIYPNFGMPVHGQAGKFGDMLVKVKFDFNSLKLLKAGERKQLVSILNQLAATSTPKYRIPPQSIEITGQLFTRKIQSASPTLPVGLTEVINQIPSDSLNCTPS